MDVPEPTRVPQSLGGRHRTAAQKRVQRCAFFDYSDPLRRRGRKPGAVERPRAFDIAELAAIDAHLAARGVTECPTVTLATRSDDSVGDVALTIDIG